MKWSRCVYLDLNNFETFNVKSFLLQTKIILVLLQLYYLHVNAIRLHETTNEATTSAAPIAATTPMTNVSVVDDDDETVGNTTNAVNTTEFVKTESKSWVSKICRPFANVQWYLSLYCRIKNDWPTRKSKPDLIVIKKKKLVTKQISSSFSNDKINVPQSNAGPSPENDESKETNNFVPSPELSEEYSHELVTHDTYPVSVTATFSNAILLLFIWCCHF